MSDTMERTDNLGLATILKEMEELINNSSKVPLSSKVMIDSEVMLDFVDKIYAALPDELKKAQQVLEHSDKLLETVEDCSKRIISEARDQAEQLTMETEIYREAAMRAQTMLKRAELASIQLRHESIMYCDDVLRQLEDNIEHTLSSIHQNREDLKSFKYYSIDDIDFSELERKDDSAR